MALPDGFVYLDEAVPGAACEPMYACAENFTGAIVDGYEAQRVVGSAQLAQALCGALAQARSRGLGLLLYDAYRPQRAVNRFEAWASAPEDGRTKDDYYPTYDKTTLFERGFISHRSGHTRGSTVDLTLTDAQGRPLDMGGRVDLMDPRSYHGAQGLTQAQADARALLRDIMEAQGFEPYSKEWWHYRLRDEPYPDTYFDFPVA